MADQIYQQMGGPAPEQEARLRKELLELRLRFEMDEIPEQQYEQRAAEITRRLQALTGADESDKETPDDREDL